MYKCLDCGHIFEKGEESVWIESRGECFGFQSYEKMQGCPLCGGDFQETKPCKICGSEHLEDELNENICDDCIDKYKYDESMCYLIGKHDTETIDINCFLAAMFSVSEIEEILVRELASLKKYKHIDCSRFINQDRSWFAEVLEKEVAKR